MGGEEGKCQNIHKGSYPGNKSSTLGSEYRYTGIYIYIYVIQRAFHSGHVCAPWKYELAIGDQDRPIDGPGFHPKERH